MLVEVYDLSSQKISGVSDFSESGVNYTWIPYIQLSGDI